MQIPPKLTITPKFAFLLFLISVSSFAQVAKSPYSSAGLGEVSNGFLNNNGMGGVGLANPTPYTINYLNPALLPSNRVTSFSFGIGGETRTAISDGKTQKNINGNLLYLAFAFPIAKKYTVGVGLTPLTTINYNYSTLGKVDNSNDLARYGLKGDGGINSLYLSQGYQLTKNLALGLSASYLFGAIDTYTTSQIIYAQEYTVEKYQSVNYRGFLLKPSVAYRGKIRGDYFFNAGFTYQLKSRLNASQFLALQRKSADKSLLSSDTIYNDVNSKVKYPQAFGAGIGFEKLGKWSIGLDLKSQKWSSFKGLKSDSIKDSYSVSLGGEILPNLYSSNLLRRMIFRGGFNYSKTMLYYNTTQLNDYSFSLGTSIPVRGLSFIDLSFTAGTRGTTSNHLIQENYYKVSIGISLNDRSWFIRPKLD